MTTNREQVGRPGVAGVGSGFRSGGEEGRDVRRAAGWPARSRAEAAAEPRKRALANSSRPVYRIH